MYYLQEIAIQLGVQNSPSWGDGYDQVWVITDDQSTQKVKSFETKKQPFVAHANGYCYSHQARPF